MKKVKTILTTNRWVIPAVGFFLAISVFIVSLPSRKSPSVASATTENIEFTLDELSQYNGTDPDLPILLALDGLVYNVTSGKKFYFLGGPYHDLAGKDSSKELHIAGGEIIKRKYPVVGKLK